LKLVPFTVIVNPDKFSVPLVSVRLFTETSPLKRQLFAAVRITILSEEVGTAAGVQFAGTDQSDDADPFQVKVVWPDTADAQKGNRKKSRNFLIAIRWIMDYGCFYLSA
jgi:hypothetical protein